MDSDVSDSQSFKNRKAGLVIFGILTILGGCICLLFALLAAAAPMLAAQNPNPPATPVNAWPGVIIYGGLAIAFVWLGIGSIMARRWARALLAVLSWTFFVLGVLTLALLAIMAPQMKQAMAAAQSTNAQSPLPDSAQTMILVGTFLFAALFMVIGPLVWALFYSGRNVKATCEALDPTPRWTDRCPLPVLALSLWILFGGIAMLVMSMFYPFAPFFGLVLGGNIARGYHFCLALIWFYSAWALYRLDRRAWWIIFIVMTASTISGLITFSRHDVLEIYDRLGYSAQQMAFVKQIGFSSRITLWSMMFGTVPLLVYLLYVRKFFRPAQPKPVSALQT